MAANTLTQNRTGVTYSAATTVNAAFVSAGTSGSLYVAALTSEVAGGLSVSDNRNGSYTNDSGTAATTLSHTAVFSVVNTSTLTATVTGTISSSDYGMLKIYEITNSAGTPFKNTAGNGAGDSTAATVSITTTADNCTVIASACSSVPGSANTNYTLDFGPTALNFDYHHAQRRTDAGTAGGITLTFNLGTPGNWGIAVAAYQPPVASTGGGPLVGGRLTGDGRMGAQLAR